MEGVDRRKRGNTQDWLDSSKRKVNSVLQDEDVLLMSRRQISVFGVVRLCVHSVWVNSDQSSHRLAEGNNLPPNTPPQPDD